MNVVLPAMLVDAVQQFEPAALKQSIRRLLEASPRCLYLTHFGRVTDAPRLAALLDEQIDAMVALAEGLRTSSDRHSALKTGLLGLCRQQLQRHGVHAIDAGLAGLALDIELNAQGLGIWLDKQAG